MFIEPFSIKFFKYLNLKEKWQSYYLKVDLENNM